LETESLRKELQSLNEKIKISEEVWVGKWGLDAQGYANFDHLLPYLKLRVFFLEFCNYKMIKKTDSYR
jgi:hypothetical protein